MLCRSSFHQKRAIVDNKLLLAKCITLLFKESLLAPEERGSRELIEESIKKIQPREVALGLGMDKDVVTALRNTVVDMLSTPHDHGVDRIGLLQRIRLDVGDNDKLYQAIEKGLQDDGVLENIRKAVLSTRRSIERHLKELQVAEVLTSAAASWNYRRDKITDTREFLTSIWSQLEPLAALKTKEDPALIDEIRLGDHEQTKRVVESIRTSVVENRIYRTGWQGVNRMLQGGVRPGEFWIWPASLQHKYKTGFAQTTFNQIALYNKPMSLARGKKPAIVAFSFEDTTSERVSFIFKQLMYTERRELVDISSYTIEQMQSFITEKLRANGFEIFIYRVNPSHWTHAHLFNKILELEREGYEIEFCLIDYLEKLPTTGCNQIGPSGNDILDLFSRVRAFFSSKGIACVTPHQLSVESKRLVRGTITDEKFVQALVGRGYYKGTSQLDQIPDGILLSHLFSRGDKTYLAIQRDRHRISSIVNENYKHMYLEFPDNGMPIPDDLDGNDSTLYRLPPNMGNVSESLFNFN